VRHTPWLIVVAAAAVGLAAGAGVRYVWVDEPTEPAASASGPSPEQVIGEPRPPFTLPDLEHEERAIASFEGRVVLLNFWATWCPPCVEEMPVLDRLAADWSDQGLRVVGVALDERSAVQQFAADHGIRYPLLIGGRDAYALVRDYGNARATLPYTVVIDRDGTVRRIHQGALEAGEAEQLVRPYL